MTPTVHTYVSSPLGPLYLAACDEGLTHLLFADEERPSEVPREPDHPVLAQAATELERYFAGALTAFTVPLAPQGTAFQLAVWQALSAISYGARVSYRDIARAIGRLGAERAVGAANGQNHIGIIIPCHRVIGSNGTLTGYAGGLDKKRWLLDLEARVRPQPQGELFPGAL